MNYRPPAADDRRIPPTLDRLVTAAQLGWGPEDLLHILGRDAHALIYRVAPRVPARVTSAALRRAWLSFGPPPCLEMPRGAKLEGIIKKLQLLPRLRDVELLAAARDAKEAQSAPEESEQERARRKIQLLLNKAESTEFEDEADALIAKAQTLRQRYRVATVLTGEEQQFVCLRVRISPPWVKHQFALLCAIACVNGATALLLDERGIATVIGTHDDAVHIADLFYSLNRQCDWHMRHGEGAALAQSAGATAVYRRSFRLAYAARIEELLATSMSGSCPCSDDGLPTGGNLPGPTEINRALPVLRRRVQEAEAVRDRLFPALSTMSLSMTNRLGIHDGLDAAGQAHLSGDSSGLPRTGGSTASQPCAPRQLTA